APRQCQRRCHGHCGGGGSGRLQAPPAPNSHQPDADIHEAATRAAAPGGQDDARRQQNALAESADRQDGVAKHKSPVAKRENPVSKREDGGGTLSEPEGGPGATKGRLSRVEGCGEGQGRSQRFGGGRQHARVGRRHQGHELRPARGVL
ncbi:unnamed protein product, partial [Ixodes pacificus]